MAHLRRNARRAFGRCRRGAVGRRDPADGGHRSDAARPRRRRPRGGISAVRAARGRRRGGAGSGVGRHVDARVDGAEARHPGRLGTRLRGGRGPVPPRSEGRRLCGSLRRGGRFGPGRGSVRGSLRFRARRRTLGLRGRCGASGRRDGRHRRRIRRDRRRARSRETVAAGRRDRRGGLGRCRLRPGPGGIRGRAGRVARNRPIRKGRPDRNLLLCRPRAQRPIRSACVAQRSVVHLRPRACRGPFIDRRGRWPLGRGRIIGGCLPHRFAGPRGSLQIRHPRHRRAGGRSIRHLGRDPEIGLTAERARLRRGSEPHVAEPVGQRESLCLIQRSARHGGDLHPGFRLGLPVVDQILQRVGGQPVQLPFDLGGAGDLVIGLDLQFGEQDLRMGDHQQRFDRLSGRRLDLAPQILEPRVEMRIVQRDLSQDGLCRSRMGHEPDPVLREVERVIFFHDPVLAYARMAERL
ncbi:hypothetical protein PARU111607_13655 [Palleronia rufa]